MVEAARAADMIRREDNMYRDGILAAAMAKYAYHRMTSIILIQI